MRSTSRRRNAAVVAGGLVLLLSTAACGSDGSSSKPLAIEGGERGAAMYFDPDSETVPAGTYDVTFDNVGAVHHELALVDASGEALAARSIAGKQTATFEVELEPGTHRMVCREPGHEAAGMVGELTVTDG